MPELIIDTERLSLTIAIGGMAVRVNTSDSDFLALLHNRYAGFADAGDRPESQPAEMEFDIELTPPGGDPHADVSVTCRAGRWLLSRGDFRAEWDPASHHGWIRQSANPYSIDAVLRIAHTLVLAKRGGFLMHSASAIRN